MLEGIRSLGGAGLALVLAAALAGCSATQSEPKITATIETVAILPLVPGGPGEGEWSEGAANVPPESAGVVTAQIYGALVERPMWRLVPDLSVQQALLKIPSRQPIEGKARGLGRETAAEAVFCGTVSRFVERQGSEYGASVPASVSFQIELVLVSSGEVIWRGGFDKTQEPLTSNLFNWWMFWEAGPRWLTAGELARLGVEHLLEELHEQMTP